MTQLDLLAEPARARRRDPATSHEAAARVREFGEAQQALILKTLRRFRMAGAEQLAAALLLDAYAIRKRLPELEKQGKVRPTGMLRTTTSGRHERVWEAL